MQTNLEKNAIIERDELEMLNPYNDTNAYNHMHKNAISDGDVKGKGTNSGGHGSYLPDYSKGKDMIDYSNFDTDNGGGKYDIEGRNGHGGRNKSLTNRIWGKNNPYGPSVVDTTINRLDGQYSTN